MCFSSWGCIVGHDWATELNSSEESSVYMYRIFFIHSSIDGHLGCFHVLTIVNNATMNMGCMCKIVIFDSHSNTKRWKWFPFWFCLFVLRFWGVSWDWIKEMETSGSQKTCQGPLTGTGIQTHVQMTPKTDPLTSRLCCLIHSGSFHL